MQFCENRAWFAKGSGNAEGYLLDARSDASEDAVSICSVELDVRDSACNGNVLPAYVREWSVADGERLERCNTEDIGKR